MRWRNYECAAITGRTVIDLQAVAPGTYFRLVAEVVADGLAQRYDEATKRAWWFCRGKNGAWL